MLLIFVKDPILNGGEGIAVLGLEELEDFLAALAWLKMRKIAFSIVHASFTTPLTVHDYFFI